MKIPQDVVDIVGRFNPPSTGVFMDDSQLAEIIVRQKLAWMRKKYTFDRPQSSISGHQPSISA